MLYQSFVTFEGQPDDLIAQFTCKLPHKSRFWKSHTRQFSPHISTSFPCRHKNTHTMDVNCGKKSRLSLPLRVMEIRAALKFPAKFIYKTDGLPYYSVASTKSYLTSAIPVNFDNVRCREAQRNFIAIFPEKWGLPQ